jgi:hypothetical protein
MVPRVATFRVDLMNAWLRCEVGAGQLNSEFMIRTKTSDGQEFTLFAPQETVNCPHPPSGWEFVQGHMKVKPVQTTNGDVLVKLPAESFELGYLVKVRESALDSNPQLQQA